MVTPTQNRGTAVFRHSLLGFIKWALHLSPLGDDSDSHHPYFLAGQSLFENNGGNIADFALELGEWHHVVLRVVDGLVDMHVDGIEVFSNQTNGSFQTTSNAEFVFGSTNNTPANDSFIGLMDDVGVWNRGIVMQKFSLFIRCSLRPWAARMKLLQLQRGDCR